MKFLIHRIHESGHTVNLVDPCKHIFRAVFCISIWYDVRSQVTELFVLEEHLISECHLHCMEDVLPVC